MIRVGDEIPVGFRDDDLVVETVKHHTFIVLKPAMLNSQERPEVKRGERYPPVNTL